MGAGYGVVALMPIILSGAAVLMLPVFNDAKSLGFYPIGLLLALMWQQVGPLLVGVIGRPTVAQILIYSYGFVAALLSLAATAAVFLFEP
ncbi:hypothetical protein SAMN04490198_2301 [Pseudomonas palleroniana]|nr:hypothetical protein SAMN04490198_2301 [Pseudomonas palleroniana]